MSHLSRLLATFFYSGLIPYAPGTWGSIAAILLWWFISPISTSLQIILIVSAIVIGTITSEITSRDMGKDDPGEIVIDEVAGMWLALLFLPKSILLFSLAFILFRIFDITKPWIIGKIQSLHGGFGIMLDDILAGILARLILLVIGMYL